MVKKSVSFLLFAALLFAGLVPIFGGGNAQSKAANVSIEWWSLWDADIADQIIADFQAANPNITVVRTQHGDPEIWDAMVVATATKSGPDIFFNWTGPYQKSFYQKGSAISLNDYAKQYGWTDRFIPAAAEAGTYDGNLTLIPYQFNGMGLIYKKSVFAQYGMKEPTTYTELSAMCDKFVANGILPFSIGGIDPWHAMRWADALLDQYCGPALHDKLNDIDDTSVSWNCPEVIAAFTELSKWVPRGWVDSNFAGVAEADSYMPLYNGKAAMNLEGDWAEQNIKQAGFDSADYGFFLFPRDGGKGRLQRVVSGVALTGFNGKEKTDTAAKFIDFILKPDSVNKYISLMGSLSGIKGAPIDPSASILQQVSKLLPVSEMMPPTDG
ncbi:MAG: ABC transporter substrate-binding protein, partial [Clostridia bacterium]|nr:ABC transporter substrate-binding protein [Clostridia bacterium]